jgi:hypothetical protein
MINGFGNFRPSTVVASVGMARSLSRTLPLGKAGIWGDLPAWVFGE